MSEISILDLNRIKELTEYKTTYKEKKNIVDGYNQSILFYKEHLLYLNSNSYSGAKQQLIPAGTLLYNVIEWAYKHLLHNTYFKEREGKRISAKECKELQAKLKKAETKNNFLVSQINSFYKEELDLYEIDLSIIAQYAYILNNGPKHYGEDPDKEKFEIVAEIVKKFILYFIDSSAYLRPIKESKDFIDFDELYEIFSLQNENYSYVLITDDTTLDLVTAQNLLKIKWNLIIDFDTESDVKGLLNHYKLQSNLRPITGELSNSTIRELNIRRETPYWIMGRGYSDRPETVIDSNMFIRKYGRFVNEYFQQFRSLYPEPVKVVILNQNKLLMERLMQDIDAVYADFDNISSNIPDYEFLLFKNTVIDLDPIINAKILKYEDTEFIDFLNNLSYSSTEDFGNYVVPADPYEENNNKTLYELESEFYEELKISGELLYVDIDKVDYENYSESEDRERFYKGETEISWTGIKRHFDVERKEIFNLLKRDIEKLLINRGTAEKSVRYVPGVGGTTLLRRIALEFHSKYPTLILKNYLEGITDNTLFELYRKSRKTIFILVDSNNFNKDNLAKLKKFLNIKRFPAVLLYLEREIISRKSNGNDEFSIDYFTKDEEYFMKDKLMPYIKNDEDAKRRLNELVQYSKPEERIPIIMSLTAFQDNFKGIKSYIAGFLKNLNQTQKKFLVYLSLVDYAINKPIEEVFFRKSGEEIFQLNSNNAFTHLIKTNYNDKTFKIKYPIFSQEILRQISNPNEGNSERKGIIISNLLNYILEFIEDSRFLSNSTSKRTEILLRELFITREEKDMIRDKFAPLIEKIISEKSDNQNLIIGKIFKKLSEVYPEEPHYLAHLARYYFYIDKNYQAGKETIKTALAIFEQKEGSKDSHLYHMQAMGQVAEITSKLIPAIKEANRLQDWSLKDELLKQIKQEAKIAFEIFEEVRSLSSKGLAMNLAGYISDISLCINLVDMGVHIESKTNISDFLADAEVDNWYRMVIDRAFNLFEDSKKFPMEESRELNTDVEASIQRLRGNLSGAISIWEKYIQNDNPDNPRVRRMLARAYEESLDSIFDENYYRKLEDIKSLMESNMNIEPENGNNIRIWFETIRKTLSSSSEDTLDQAILTLQDWIAESDTIEAHYYYFILAFIKAVNNSTEYEQKLPYLLARMKEKAFNSPNSRKTFEWLGYGEGLDALISDKDFYKKEKDERDLTRLRTLTGRITPNFSTSNQAAYISLFGIEIFFNPTYTVGIDRSKKNQRVQFGVGFSFEGPRAFNSTVKLLEAKANEEELINNEELIKANDYVKFEVTGENEYYYTGIIVRTKSFGSIHKNQLLGRAKPSLGTMLDLKVSRKKYLQGKGEVWELETFDIEERNFNNIFADSYNAALENKKNKIVTKL